MITTNLKPPAQIQPDDVIDIANSRNLLKPASQRLLHPRSVSGSVLSPRQSQISLNRTHSMTKIQDQLENENIMNENCEVLDQEGDPEAKLILFEAAKCRILQFEDNSMDNESQGRLLGSGKFEIYQLHQKRVSYLSCGKSVVYPILPRLKILKISRNQFLVTLSNPERYWRIIIDTDNDSDILRLEKTLKSICSFRNVWIKPDPLERPITPQMEHTEVQENTRPLFDIKTTFSTASITSEMACFQITDSDATTFVEHADKSRRNVSTQSSQETVINHPLDLLEGNQMPETIGESDAESLDLAFDEFTRTIEEETTRSFFTSNSIQRHTKDYNSLLSNKTATTSSSSFNLLGAEDSNWMGLEDDVLTTNNDSMMKTAINLKDGFATTSTPNTQRYISLNLNPRTPKRSERNHKGTKTLNSKLSNEMSMTEIENVKKSRNFGDSSFFEIQKLQNKLRIESDQNAQNDAFTDIRTMKDIAKQKQENRLSSFDVYNILRDADENNETDRSFNNPKQNSSFTGFLKSFF